MSERLLNLFASYAFTDAYWNGSEKGPPLGAAEDCPGSPRTRQGEPLLYGVPCRKPTRFPSMVGLGNRRKEQAGKAFTNYNAVTEAGASTSSRHNPLWIHSVSQYFAGKSEQDMDPINDPRPPISSFIPSRRQRSGI